VTAARSRLLLVPIVAGVLGACGGAFEAPAAVVNGFEISQESLDDEVRVALTDPNLAAEVDGPGGAERRTELTRQVLSFLIRQRLIQSFARTQQITVSESEVDAEFAATVEQVGGQAVLDRELKSRGLTPQDVRTNIERALLANKVVQAVGQQEAPAGTVPTPEELDQAFGEWLRDQMVAADIQINPRFGALNLEQASVCRVVSTSGDTSCSTA
jgi:SurA-like N-terminal domain